MSLNENFSFLACRSIFVLMKSTPNKGILLTSTKQSWGFSSLIKNEGFSISQQSMQLQKNFQSLEKWRKTENLSLAFMW